MFLWWKIKFSWILIKIKSVFGRCILNIDIKFIVFIKGHFLNGFHWWFIFSLELVAVCWMNLTNYLTISIHLSQTFIFLEKLGLAMHLALELLVGFVRLLFPYCLMHRLTQRIYSYLIQVLSSSQGLSCWLLMFSIIYF